MKKIFVCLCLTFLLTACGWHVRGSVALPKQLSHLYVSATDNRGALVTDLRQLLKTNHITLVDDPAAANYSLNIIDETKDRHTSGVGGDELTSSYEITLKSNYEIQLKNSTVVDKRTAISVRNFNYNTSAINSATQEELLLDQEMRRDLTQQILRSLSTVIANTPNTALAIPTSTQKTTEPTNGKTAP